MFNLVPSETHRNWVTNDQSWNICSNIKEPGDPLFYLHLYSEPHSSVNPAINLVTPPILNYTMSLTKILTSALLLSSALLAHTQVISGSARIIVLKSDDWRKVDIVKDKVGCVNNEGRFIDGKNIADCGIFTHLDDYPYTVSFVEGETGYGFDSFLTYTPALQSDRQLHFQRSEPGS